MPDISLIPPQQKKRALPRFSTFNGPRFQLGTATKVGIVLLSISFFASVGVFVWNQSLKSKKEVLQEEFKNVVLTRDVSLDRKLKDVNALIQSFDGLIKDHRNWSELFSILESRTLLGVVFTSFEASYQKTSFSLKGVSSSYNLLAQQIKSFEEEEAIVRVDASKIGLNKEGAIDFTIVVTFKKQLLKKSSAL